jgi:hypothetical protein
MTEEEIDAAERTLGQRYPAELRTFLGRTRGFDGNALLEEIDFAGLLDGQALEELFPRAATIANDGYGNFWAVDLLRENGSWGPIWFLCHDAPVALLQCHGLAPFLDELVRMYTPPHASPIDDVHEDRLFRVWREHPGTITSADASASDDPLLASFRRRPRAGLDARRPARRRAGDGDRLGSLRTADRAPPARRPPALRVPQARATRALSPAVTGAERK